MAKPTHNYYDILHVSPNATQDEIRHAFNKMSHAFHPDHHATEKEGDREEFEQEFRLVRSRAPSSLRRNAHFATP